jgi:hypothetical protein
MNRAITDFRNMLRNRFFAGGIIMGMLAAGQIAPVMGIGGLGVGNRWDANVDGDPWMEWNNMGDLVLIDCEKKELKTLVTGHTYGACFSPDGKKVAYIKDCNSIWTVNIDGTANTKVTDNTGWAIDQGTCLTWIPGDWIYWAGGSNLERVKPDGSQRSVVWDAGQDLVLARVNSNGTRVGRDDFRLRPQRHPHAIKSGNSFDRAGHRRVQRYGQGYYQHDNRKCANPLHC